MPTNSNSPLTDISQFGTSNSMDPSFDSPVEAKSASLIEAAKDKTKTVDSAAGIKTAQLGGKSIFEQGLYGTPEEKSRIIAAILGGTELGQSEGARDLMSGSEAIYNKYGVDAAFDVANFSDAYFAQKDLLDRQRSTGQAIGDTAIDLGVAGANMVGGAAILGATGLDFVGQSDQPISPGMSEKLGEFNEWAQGNKSQLAQDRTELSAVTGQLRADDSEAQYQRNLKAAAGEESNWDRTIQPWVNRTGRDFVNAVDNITNDPIVLGSTVAQGAGSMIPLTAGARIAGKAVAISKLIAKGMTKAEAKKELKTAAGKKLLNEEATKVAPYMAGLAESGGAISQTQQAIMGMGETELAESEEYQALRADNKSHEEAKRALAVNAGALAGVTALPGALAAGKLASGVIANPLSVIGKGKGPGSTIIAAATNIAKESVEEIGQGANAQLASNIGLNKGAGLDVALDEGVAAAAAEEFVGGLGSTAAMQAPKVALGTTKELGTVAAQGAKKAFKAKQASDVRKEDQTSPTGSVVRAEKDLEATVAAETIINAPVTEEASVEQTAAKEIVQAATFIDDVEVEDYAQNLNIEKDDQGRIRTSQVFEALSAKLLDESDTDVSEDMLSVEMLTTLTKMSSINSTELEKQMAALPDGDPTKQAHATLVDQIATIKGSKAAIKATSVIEKMTLEDTQKIIPIDDKGEGKLNPDQLAAVKVITKVKANEIVAKGIDSLSPAQIAAYQAIAAVNINAVSAEQGDAVLNQMKPGADRDTVKSFRDISVLLENVEKRRQDAAAERDIVIEQFDDPEVKAREQDASTQQDKDAQSRANIAAVSFDISDGGNSRNELASAAEHHRRFAVPIGEGRVEDALDAHDALGNFAQALINKTLAYGKSAQKGKRKLIKFMNHNGVDAFKDEAGVFIDLNSPSSVSLAIEAWGDASALVGMYNIQMSDPRLAGQAGDKQALTMPPLDPAIVAAAANGPSTKTQSEPAKKKATTGENADGKLGKRARKAARKAEAATEKANAEKAAKDADVSQTQEAGAQVPDAAQAPQEVVEPSVETTTTPTVETPTEPAAETETAAKRWLNGMKETLLKGKNGFNVFLDSYKPSQKGSSLTTHENPMAFIIANLDNLIDDSNSLDRSLTPKERDALKGLAAQMDKDGSSFAEQFSAAIKDKKLKAALEKTNDPLSYPNAYPLNFALEEGDSPGEIEARVMQATMMAVYEWAATEMANGQSKLRDKDITALWKMPPNSIITKKMREFAETGGVYQTAISEISTKIEKLLGVSPDRSKSASHTQGLMKSMATNALDVLIESKRVTLNETTFLYEESDNDGKVIDKKPSYRTIYTVTVNQEAEKNKLFENLRAMPDVFTRIFTKDADKVRYVGTPPKSLAQTQIRNKFGKLSKSELSVEERLSNEPSHFNKPMLDLVAALGESTYMSLVGHKETEGVASNPEHLARVISKNRSIEQGMAGVVSYMQEAEALVADDSNEFTTAMDVPVFFAWAVSKVGRLQQQGTVTPQGSKTFREMIAATNSVMDLNDFSENGDRQILDLAIAQSLGVKIEAMSRAKAIQKSEEMLSDEMGLSPALRILTEWLKNGGNLDSTAFAKALNDNGIKGTDKLLHALLTAARIDQANEIGGSEASQFETALAIEADGKTDGPLNALIHMGLGAFGANDIKRFAKGGLFFSNRAISLSDYQNTYNKDDIYTETAEVLKIKLADEQQKLSDEKLVEMNAMLRTFGGLLDGFDVTEPAENEMEFEILRDVTKNPLTIFLYGSGIKGIAGNVAESIIKNFYAQLDDLAKGMEDGIYTSWRDHPVLGKKDLMPSFRTMLMKNPDVKDPNKSSEAFALNVLLRDPTSESKILKDTTDNLRDKIQVRFGPSLEEAINETTGHLSVNMKMTQGASNIQSALFQDAFNKLMQKKIANRAPDKNAPKRQLLLSEDELQDVFEETIKISPTYTTDMQEFFVSTGEAYQTDNTVSSNFFGKKSTGASVPQPKDAGVKVSPYMTIGTGDGRMMINIYLESDGALNASLAVFDGVEQSVSNAVAGSSQINKAALNGWLDGNIYKSIHESFAETVSYLTKDVFMQLDPATIDKIGRALDVKKDESFNIYSILAKSNKLREYSEQSQARKAAMRRMGMSVDHMAGLGLPHVQEGFAVEDGSPDNYEAIAKQLNEFYREELQAIQAARETKNEEPAVEQPDAELTAAIEAIGSKVSGHPDVTMLRGDQVVQLLGSRAKPFTPILRKAQNVMAATYYFGTSEALGKLDEHKGESVKLGQTTVSGKYVFIANNSKETLLHEMLHGLTARTLVDYYQEPDAQPAHIKDAVKRLEFLMEDVRSMSSENNKTKGMDIALATLHGELDGFEGRPALQMTEFLSWTLANQSLMELTSARKVRSRLVKVSKAVLNGLRDLLGLGKAHPGETMFSSIVFNTQVLTAKSDMAVKADLDNQTNATLNQTFGADSRLDNIENRFLQKLAARLAFSAKASRPKGVGGDALADADSRRLTALDIAARSKAVTVKAAEYVNSKGFHLNLREAQAFKAVHSAMISGMQMDTRSVSAANKLISHTIKEVTANSFLEAEGIDPAFATKSEKKLADKRLEALFGSGGLRRIANGNTDLLATFMALSQTSPVLRKVLQNLKAPAEKSIQITSMDNAITRVINSIFDFITAKVADIKNQSASTIGRLDALSHSLSDIQAERNYIASYLEFTSMEKLNKRGADFIEKASENATQSLVDRRNKRTAQGKDGKVTRAIAAAELITSLGSKNRSAAVSEIITKFTNKLDGYDSLRSVWSDIRGETESTAPLTQLVNVAKSTIDAIRQDFREEVPEQLAARFKAKITKEQWEHTFTVHGDADITALGATEASALMLDPTKVGSMIKAEEEVLSQLAGKLITKYKSKSKALAIYMVTKEVTTKNLLRNSYAIAHLNNEENLDKNLVDAKTIKSIDRLASLYAFDLVDDATKASVKKLMKTEPEGMRILTGTHESTRELEKTNKRTPVGRNNGWKGYVPSTTQDGASVIVAPSSVNKELTYQGYERMGNFVGSDIEGSREPREYYQSTVSGQNAFKQGAAQTIHPTYQGVDSRTGITKGGSMAGIVKGKELPGVVRRFKAKMHSNGKIDGLAPGQYLLPVNGANGELLGFEIPMDPSMTESLNKNRNLPRMLGVWMGRIVEEKVAEDFNVDLLKTLKETYDQEVAKGNGDQFINVANPGIKDAVYKDAWDALGHKIKEDAEEVFGRKKFFPVRIDMAKDAVGYRSAGLTDAWTGVTRFSPEVQKGIINFAEFVAGKHAFKILKHGERAITGAVSIAKTTIIVRSVVVTVGNLVSNTTHLQTLGLNPISSLKAMRDKYIEVTQYVANKTQISNLHLSLAADIKDRSKVLKLKAQIRALEDANNSMSIKPLIDAGEFSTVAEGLTEADEAARTGKLGELFEKAVSKLPDAAVTIGKNILITKDTPIFKALNRTVQYGDFVAKAVLYDHQMNKGIPEKEVLAQIADEFVNYNTLPGRGRDALESFGLLWFFNYTLRINKVAARTIRNRPASAVLFGAGVGPMFDIDTVFDSSLPASIAQGKIAYKLGWGMGLDSPGLMPVNNILN
jgi:hypothetical protein